MTLLNGGEQKLHLLGDVERDVVHAHLEMRYFRFSGQMVCCSCFLVPRDI